MWQIFFRLKCGSLLVYVVSCKVTESQLVCQLSDKHPLAPSRPSALLQQHCLSELVNDDYLPTVVPRKYVTNELIRSETDEYMNFLKSMTSGKALTGIK